MDTEKKCCGESDTRSSDLGEEKILRKTARKDYESLIAGSMQREPALAALSLSERAEAVKAKARNTVLHFLLRRRPEVLPVLLGDAEAPQFRLKRIKAVQRWVRSEGRGRGIPPVAR